MLHIAVVVHRYAPFGQRYWLHAISRCWAEAGIRVSVIDDPKAQVEADVAILHVDRTVVPEDYLACVRRCAVTVNGAVSDISKRVVSANLLHREDRYDGPVIVKTNRNCGGAPEMQLAKKAWNARKRGEFVTSAVGRLREKYIGIRRRWRYGSERAFVHYRIFESMAEVPEPVWGDSDLVVERFLPERLNGRYCARTWLFFGDQDRHALFYSNRRIIKSHNIIGYERLGEVPEELRQIRRDLKFDFGKFDYTMVDNRPVLFDANRTPTIGRFPKERYLPIVESLAEGISAFVQYPLAARHKPMGSEPKGNGRVVVA